MVSLSFFPDVSLFESMLNNITSVGTDDANVISATTAGFLILFSSKK